MKSRNISGLLKIVMILTILAEFTVYVFLGEQHQVLCNKCKVAVEAPVPTEEEYSGGYLTPLAPPPVIEVTP